MLSYEPSEPTTLEGEKKYFNNKYVFKKKKKKLQYEAASQFLSKINRISWTEFILEISHYIVKTILIFFLIILRCIENV